MGRHAMRRKTWVVLGLLLPAAQHASAQVVKLNKPIHEGILHVRDLQLDGAGRRVVYAAGQSALFDVYVAPLIGGPPAPTRLSSCGIRLDELDLAPDGSRVVYTADGFFAGSPMELYSAPIDGSAEPVRLSGQFIEGGDVASFRVSPDGSQVAYVADQDVDQRLELYAAAIDGGLQPVVLSGTLVEGGQVQSFLAEWNQSFQFDPLGEHVAFLADREVDERVELYIASVAGGAEPLRLNDPLVEGGDVQRFLFSPDGTRVLYVADQEINGAGELYAAPADGSGVAIQLSGPLPPGGSVAPAFGLSLDGELAVYQAYQGVPGAVDLYAVPTDGSSAPLKLHPTVPGGGAFAFRISPDASRVVFLADHDTEGVLELYSSPTDGSSSAVKLNGPLTASGAVSSSFEITSDGARVVYVADQDTNGVLELYGAPIDGSAPAVKISGPFGEGTGVSGFRLTPGGMVVYRAWLEVDRSAALFAVPADGSSEPVALHDPLEQGDVTVFELASDGIRVVFQVTGEDGADEILVARLDVEQGATPLQSAGRMGVDELEISSSGSFAVYRADQETPLVMELYRVPADGSAGPTRLNGDLQEHGDVHAFTIGSADRRVVYIADQNTDDVDELFSASLEGTGSPVRLNAPLVQGGDVASFSFGPFGRVVYLADQEKDDLLELFSVPIDAIASPVRLHGSFPGSGGVERFAIDPTGHMVVFTADWDPSTGHELYAVSIDGTSGPVRLDSARFPGPGVESFLIDPFGIFAVFRARMDGGPFELFSVPIDGSREAAVLNRPLPAGGDVCLFDYFLKCTPGDYQISSDGSRVVYLADQDVNGVLELFSAPIDGSELAVQLNGSLPPSGQVAEFRISPGGRRVVYLADQEQPGKRELYAVPTAGGMAPVKVSGAHPAFADVLPGFTVLPGAPPRVAYLADSEVDARFELHTAPVNASARPARIAPGLRVEDFLASRDGAMLAFRVGQGLFGPFEIYAASSDGSGAARKISAPIVPCFGQLWKYAITAPGDRVLYVADQDTQNARELYATPTSPQGIR